jgi:hypothetical protein
VKFPLSLTISSTITREWLSMMEDLPLDTNNPRVRDYLALIRHVSGRSQKLEWSGLTKPPMCGIQVASLDAPQSVGEHYSGAGM